MVPTLEGSTEFGLIRVLADHVSIGLRHSGELRRATPVEQPKVVLTVIIHALEKLLARCVHL